MNRTYDFSVVTAVYNAEPFLPETVRSLLKQSFDFSRVQLILVDDGSTDGSGAMCDAFRKAHPDNIVVVHQANGGVSAARNEGLRHVQGSYVSFLDADDCLSRDALRKVFEFFEAHPETDVVSLPMHFFDGETGEHLLNHKFRKGTRVIDLDAEPDSPQLAVTSAFIRAEALEGKSFDTRLHYAEDAKLLQTILIEKRKLGAVADAVHHYRRRSSGEASAIQRSHGSPAWYFPYLNHFCLELFDVCEARFGAIPRFVQSTVAYDLQWRIRQSRIPDGVMREAEKESYRALLISVIRRIDDDILAKQLALTSAQKVFLLRQKHGTAPAFLPSEHGRLCRYGDGEPFSIPYEPTVCDFFTVRDGVATVECSIDAAVGFDERAPELYAVANGAEYTSEPVDRKTTLLSVDLPVANRYGYVFRIPLPDGRTPLRIRFFRRTENGPVPSDELQCSRFFPVSERYRHAYADIKGRVLTLCGSELIYRKPRFLRIGREARFLAELIGFRQRKELHAVIGRLVYGLLKPFRRKPVWLVSDRMQAGGDNGEALFRYLAEQNLKDVRLYFAVSKSSPAYTEIARIGRTVDARSFRHKMLFLLSQFNISSQADDDIITQFSRYDEPYRDIQSRIRFVFLQHGVTKDDLSGWLNRYNRNCSGIVTLAEREAQSFRTCAYFYPDSAIWLTGFPRYDRLYHNERRCITIMPTWRNAWVSYTDPKTGVRVLREGFTNSDFFRFFRALLNDPRLIAAARETGYTIRFLPHPLLQPHIRLFSHSQDIEMLPPDASYRDVFAESNLILTDYSSVAFDFAYLRKPVVYAQFDRASFFSGGHTYVQGYFDYDRDGFGEVETDYEATVDRLIEYMRNDCRLKDKYRARIDSFFAFDDSDNCRRVYEKLRELQKE